ncbi:MAG: terpene cyclase/mutase family protein [Phycisphaerales bacterium]|nr:terpene cyclase/mutase family protein [Phycisphaerales bacterium]
MPARICHSISALTLLAAACGSRLALAQQQPTPEPKTATAPKQVIAPDAKHLLKDPSAPLDQRIKVEKITEYEPPPLPDKLILPKAPQHRISTEAVQVPIDQEVWKQANEAIKRGLASLRSQQDASGVWMKQAAAAPTDQPDRPSPVSIAVTALALKAFVQADPNALDDPQVQKAVRAITQSQNPDGSFDNGTLANYVTSSVLSALASIEDKDHQDLVLLATKWLQVSQWDQTEGLNARQDWFGGAGYGNHGRPDLSNTQMMLDALYDAGLSPDEPTFQKALAFASRTQNLKQTNKAEWAGNDGGFVYTPANGGESFASEAAGEGRYGEIRPEGQPRSLRSYGSMTYAGFKSMAYAGLSPDDARVRAAFDWIRNHWTFDENPGLGQQGLYYYYHTMARALNAAGAHEITDTSGVKHNWREELIQALLKRQNTNGSWVNKEEERWMEDSEILVTVYSVLALEEALKPVIQVQGKQQQE